MHNWEQKLEMSEISKELLFAILSFILPKLAKYVVNNFIFLRLISNYRGVSSLLVIIGLLLV